MLRGGGAESRRERPSAGTGFPSLTHFTVAVLRLLDFEPVIHRVLSRKIGAWSQGVSFLGELVSASVRHSWPQPTGAALNSLLALLLASQVGESFQPCLEKASLWIQRRPSPCQHPSPAHKPEQARGPHVSSSQAGFLSSSSFQRHSFWVLGFLSAS